MKHKILTFLLIASILLVTAGGPVATVTASPNAVAPDLGVAASFVGLAATTFTNTGSGVYYGNVGVFPGTAVVGFPPGSVKNGAIHAADGLAQQAQLDALAAYNDLAGRPCNTNMTAQDLGGKTLQPGVYCFNSSAQLTGDLVLDALGDPKAIWVFQMGTTLITGPGSTVRMINGGQLLNVFWQVGTSATFNSSTRFKGNVIAQVSITMVSGASLSGRALALTGGVTMDTNGSLPISNPPLNIVKQVDPVNALPGQLITYTLTFANFGNDLVAGVMISDVIPISVTATSVISSGVAITQVRGTRYGWDIAPLASGQGGIITVTGELSVTLPGGSFTNTAIITSTMLESDPENDHSSAVVTIAPRLLSPAHGLVTDATGITFTWLSSAYVAGYRLDLGGAIVDVGNTTHYYTSPLASGAYTWTVAAYDSYARMSAYALPWAFAITETAGSIYTISPIIAGTVYPLGPGLCESITFSDTGDLPASATITLTNNYPSQSHTGLTRQYRISAAGGVISATLVLCYTDAEVQVAHIANETMLDIYRYVAPGELWQTYSTVDTAANTITAYDVTNLGTFGIGAPESKPNVLTLREFNDRPGLAQSLPKGQVLAGLSVFVLFGVVLARRRSR